MDAPHPPPPTPMAGHHTLHLQASCLLRKAYWTCTAQSLGVSGLVTDVMSRLCCFVTHFKSNQIKKNHSNFHFV